MTDLWLIGIGTGNPGHLTLEGQEALHQAEVILLPRKGSGKEDLAEVRLDLLRRAGALAKVVSFDMPVRDETLPYGQRVDAWHDEIALRWQEALKAQSFEGPVALLVWGDPGLYDSTLRIAQRLEPKPAIKVFPGITALQALTAAHAVPFNTINGPVMITTGRRLRDEGWPDNAESLFVVLDGQCSFTSLKAQDFHIWWGAYLGMAEQCLIAGRLGEVSEKIQDLRGRLRAEHGWIMDTYLLRRL